MNSSTSNSSDFFLEGAHSRSAVTVSVLSLIATGLIIAGIEILFVHAGGQNSVVPSWTRIEYLQRFTSVEGEPIVYIVGDSRVGWGISEADANRRLRELGDLSSEVVNAGLAGQDVEPIIRLIMTIRSKQQPGVLVLNYSPAGFYSFPNRVEMEIPNINRQDLIDDAINLKIKHLIASYDRPARVIYDQIKEYVDDDVQRQAVFTSRERFPEGFVNGRLESNDKVPIQQGDEQLGNYTSMFDDLLNNAPRARARYTKLSATLQEALDRGWEIILVRLPVGPRMLELEKVIPEQWEAKVLAKELRLHFIDYNQDPRTTDIKTQDESHLTPAGARAIAPILVDDIHQILKRGFQDLPPTIYLGPNQLQGSSFRTAEDAGHWTMHSNRSSASSSIVDQSSSAVGMYRLTVKRDVQSKLVAEQSVGNLKPGAWYLLEGDLKSESPLGVSYLSVQAPTSDHELQHKSLSVGNEVNFRSVKLVFQQPADSTFVRVSMNYDSEGLDNQVSGGAVFRNLRLRQIAPPRQDNPLPN